MKAIFRPVYYDLLLDVPANVGIYEDVLDVYKGNLSDVIITVFNSGLFDKYDIDLIDNDQTIEFAKNQYVEYIGVPMSYSDETNSIYLDNGKIKIKYNNLSGTAKKVVLKAKMLVKQREV